MSDQDAADEADLSELVIYSLCLMIITSHTAWILADTWKLRSFSAVRKIDPLHSLFSTVCFLMFTVVYTLCHMFPFMSIRTYNVIILPFLGLFTSSMLLIVLSYYHKFFMQEHKLQIAGQWIENKQVQILKFPLEKVLVTVISSWILQGFLMIICTIVIITPPFVILYTYDTEFTSRKLEELTRRPVVTLLCLVDSIFASFTGFFVTFLLFHVRNLRKDRHFRRMMKTLVVAFIWVYGLLFVFYTTALLELSFKVFDYKPLILFILPLEFWQTSVSLYNHRVKKFLRKVGIQKGVNSFAGAAETLGKETLTEMEEMLQDSGGNQILLDSARRNFCVEIVLFCNAVNIWKKIKHPEDRSSFATKIFEFHIKDGSQGQINIPYECRHSIEKVFEDGLEIMDDVFDKAYEHMITLMYYQIYVDHRNSMDYQEYRKFGTSSRELIPLGKMPLAE